MKGAKLDLKPSSIERINQKNTMENPRTHISPCPFSKPSPKNITKSSTVAPKQVMSQEQNVRALPLHNKEDVFNEWGAVLRHQDEIDQKLQQQNYEKMKLRQISYKKELDKQFKELQEKRKGTFGEQVKREESLLKYQEKEIDQKIKQEEGMRIKIKLNQKKDAMTGMNVINERKKQNQMIKDLERNMHRENLQKEQKIQNDLKTKGNIKKKQDEQEYYNILGMQSKERQYKHKQDKEADRNFAKAETIKLDQEENARSQFFKKLKNIQDVNDQKHHRLLKFMEQDPAVLNSKKDEQSYIKSIELGEKKAIKKEFDEKQNRDFTKKQNNDLLSKQVQEKKMYKITEKEQRELIAKQYQQEENKVKQEQLDFENKRKADQANYYKQLNRQLKEKQKKNTYGVLMSEYERSVNDEDIKAYQNLDDQNLFAKIPGYNLNDPQQKYIDKAMNIYTPQKKAGKLDDCLCPPSSKKFETKGRNNKLQNAALSSFDNFGDGKGISLKMLGQNYSPNKIERVRQNMEKQDAIKYRANTNNRGYGFEQANDPKRLQEVSKQNNNHKSMLSVSKSANALPNTSSNPYEYNFKAPGNY